MEAPALKKANAENDAIDLNSTMLVEKDAPPVKKF